MIPEGVHAVSEDWTIFFLNQTPENTITNVFNEDDEDVDGGEVVTEDEDSGSGGGGIGKKKEKKKELLYVLNLVQTKHDATVKRYVVYYANLLILSIVYRGAIVKAMAICTHHPFIHIFKVQLVTTPKLISTDPHCTL